MILTDDFLKEFFIEKLYLKNDFLLSENDLNDNIYYIKSGVVRFFVAGVDDKEFTFNFAFAGDFVNSHNSYKNNCKSEFSIQAISVVLAYKINKERVNNIICENTNLALLFIDILEDLLIKKTTRELCLIRYTPQEIYQQLIDQKSYFIKMIPLKYLASYIGVTPQALSRIRKRIY